MSKKPRVLYVDDEPALVKFYVQRLESEFDVTFAASAEEGLRELDLRAPDFSAMVLDVMMPPPPDVPDPETDSGFETGLWLLDMFRRKSRNICRFPVTILTNRGVDLVRDGLRRREIVMECVEIHRKLDTPAFALPKLVKAAIARHIAKGHGAA